MNRQIVAFTINLLFLTGYSIGNEAFPNDNLQLWLAADQGITTKDNSSKGGSKNDIISCCKFIIRV